MVPRMVRVGPRLVSIAFRLKRLSALFVIGTMNVETGASQLPFGLSAFRHEVLLRKTRFDGDESQLPFGLSAFRHVT